MMPMLVILVQCRRRCASLLLLLVAFVGLPWPSPPLLFVDVPLLLLLLLLLHAGLDRGADPPAVDASADPLLERLHGVNGVLILRRKLAVDCLHELSLCALVPLARAELRVEMRLQNVSCDFGLHPSQVSRVLVAILLAGRPA